MNNLNKIVSVFIVLAILVTTGSALATNWDIKVVASATNVTFSSAQINITQEVSGSGVVAPLTAIIAYSKNQSAIGTPAELQTLVSGSLPAYGLSYYKQLTGLQGGTQYFYRVCVNDSVDHIVCSQVQTMNTKGLTVNAILQPTILNITNITDDSAYINAKGEFLASSTPVTAQLYLEYSANNSYLGTPSATRVNVSSAPVALPYTGAVTLVGLSSNTKYYVRPCLETVTANVCGIVSELTTEQSSGGGGGGSGGGGGGYVAQLPNIVTKNPIDITESSAVFTAWYETMGCKPTIWFEYGINNFDSDTSKKLYAMSFGSELSVYVTGLKPGRKYQVRAHAENCKGERTGSTKYFTTDGGDGNDPDDNDQDDSGQGEQGNDSYSGAPLGSMGSFGDYFGGGQQGGQYEEYSVMKRVITQITGAEEQKNQYESYKYPNVAGDRFYNTETDTLPDNRQSRNTGVSLGIGNNKTLGFVLFGILAVVAYVVGKRSADRQITYSDRV